MTAAYLFVFAILLLAMRRVRRRRRPDGDDLVVQTNGDDLVVQAGGRTFRVGLRDGAYRVDLVLPDRLETLGFLMDADGPLPPERIMEDFRRHFGGIEDRARFMEADGPDPDFFPG